MKAIQPEMNADQRRYFKEAVRSRFLPLVFLWLINVLPVPN